MATLAYLDTTSIPDRKVGVYMICNLGGRRNTYGVWSEHLRGLCSGQNIYNKLCVVITPTLHV
jgi:hypothetical protein